jgi:hypothetical protein
VSILTAILPGVRMTRAPLAAGTLVLLSMWLAVALPILAIGIVIAIRTPSLIGAIAITAGAFLLALLSTISSLRAAMQAEKILVDLIKSDVVALPWLERHEHNAATSPTRVVPAST